MQRLIHRCLSTSHAASQRAPRPGCISLACALLALAVTADARAQRVDPAPASSPKEGAAAAVPSGELPLWEAGVGLGLLRLPHYRGSDQSRSWAVPLPYAVYRGDVFKADRDGARAELIKSATWHFDFSVAAGAPTNSKDSVARAGMRDLAPTLELGPNFTWRFLRGPGWDVELRVPVRAAMTLESRPRYVGIVGSPNVNVDWRVGDWNWGAYVAALYGSTRQHAYYYEVSPDAATASRPAYAATSGFGGLQYVGGVSRRYGDFWFGAFVRVDDLRGAAFEDSPLVRRRHSTAVGLGVSWVFAKSAQRAPKRSDLR